jgi:hypothetical protein
MKLKEMEIRDSIETLLSTGLFKPYLGNHLCNDGRCQPQHLIFLNSKIYFYIDYGKYSYREKNSLSKITIMDFYERDRPEISLENFISRLSSRDATKFLFYLDLFI